MNEIEITNQKTNKKKKFESWIWLVLAMIYTISPIDAIIDAPPIGFIDDFLISSTALINFIQQQFFQGNDTLIKIFKIIKWILISLVILMILITILIITLIIK